MSRELRVFSFAVTTQDHAHWSDTDVSLADATGQSYSDWALAGLTEAMFEAGRRHIAEHPDLFATDLT